MPDDRSALPDGHDRRWVIEKSRGVQMLGLALIAIAASGVLFMVQQLGVVGYLAWAAVVGGFALKVVIDGANEELALVAGSLQWGHVGRRPAGSMALKDMAELNFYRRADGSGGVEVQFESGKRAFVPAHFTDRPQVSDALVAALRAELPQLVVHVH